MLHWVKVGDTRQKNIYMALKREFERKENLCKLGAQQLFLIKYDVRARFTCTKSTRTTQSPSLISPTDKGPHETENSPSSALLRIPFCWFEYLQQNQIEIGKRVKRRRNFTNYIPLESSRRGEHSRTIYFQFHALWITRIQGKRDSGIGFNRMIWRVIGQIDGLGGTMWAPRCSWSCCWHKTVTGCMTSC
jgi:hypothetical protein